MPTTVSLLPLLLCSCASRLPSSSGADVTPQASSTVVVGSRSVADAIATAPQVSSTAQLSETGSSSPSTASAKSNAEGIILPDLCGNGKLDPNEACDDGNRIGGDGCSGICTAEAVDLVMSNDAACVLTTLGTVKCWGNNNGLLGLGDRSNRGDEPGEMGQALPAIDLGFNVRAKSIGLGGDHTCVLTDSGRVKCWGMNCYGQLGRAVPVAETRDTPCKAIVGDSPGEMGDALPYVDLGNAQVTQLLVGSGVSCVLLANGQVKCWGNNDFHGHQGLHHLGDDPGEMGDNLPSVPLGVGRRARHLVGDAGTVCAILDNNGVKCWGDDYLKKNIHLDQGDNVVIGQYHSCILTKTGKVRCWGEGGVGQLGYPKLKEDSNGRVWLPRPPELGVTFGTGRVALLVAVGSDCTCVVLDGNQAKCWGSNNSGKLGIGHDGDERCFWGMVGNQPCRTTPPEQPIELGSAARVRKVAVGGDSTCVLLEDARVKCWGFNGGGALGLGDTVNRDTPPEQYVAY